MGFFEKIKEKMRHVKPVPQDTDTQTEKPVPQDTDTQTEKPAPQDADMQAEKQVPQDADTQAGMTDDEILAEVFSGAEPIRGESLNKICRRWIAVGLVQFAEDRFDEKGLEELSFDELCSVYSMIEWFVQNFRPDLREKAVLYKRFLRKKLLSRLSTFPVYTFHVKLDRLPYVFQDSSMLLYSSRALAEKRFEEVGEDWIELHEITPDRFAGQFCEYICTGYASVKLNGETGVKIEDIYRPGPTEKPGNLCLEACIRMVDYRQSLASILALAREEGRGLTDEEQFHLNKSSWGASQSLLRSKLLLPCELENGKPKSFFVPDVFFADGKKCRGLFTDQMAIDRFFRQSMPCLVFPDLIRDVYRSIKDDTSVFGILINPGREEYMLTREMLAQLFAEP